MMFWNDHAPPHCHARFGEDEATVSILDGIVIAGVLKRRQLRLVLAWVELHRDELLENWELARQGKPMRSLEGLR